MTETWANLGVDLHLDLGATRVRAGLEEALREAVRDGRLGPGTRLPSSRQLASDLGVARGTVAEAYAQLAAEGWLVARQGSGTVVAERVIPERRERNPDTAEPRLSYDLRPGVPDLSAFPATAWVTALRRALVTEPSTTLGYGDPRGVPRLRQELAAYLSRVRGVRTEPGQLVVCTGFAQALSLLSAVLRGRGATTVATEGWGLPHHRRAITHAGLATTALAVDDEGADTTALDDEAAVLLTPAHQYPLGPVLSPRRRSAVTRWAAERGAVVLEDDYDGEFRYDRHPVGAVQPLAPEHVAYLGTASKTLVPGLRLAWMALPGHLVDEVVEAKRLADGQSSALDQLALAELLARGGYDRHVRRARLAYRRRRDTLAASLAAEVPHVRVTGIAAGLHAVVRLPADGPTEEAVVAAAARRGLALSGLAPHRQDGTDDLGPALVVGYATPPQHAWTGALARLTATLRAGSG